jgi:hypothetical protein
MWVRPVGEIDYAPAAAGAGRGELGWRTMEGGTLSGGSCDQTGLAAGDRLLARGRLLGDRRRRLSRRRAARARRRLLYADYCQGWVRSLRLEAGAVAEQADWPTLRPGGNIPSFGEDSAGELYVLASDGRVLKMVPR